MSHPEINKPIQKEEEIKLSKLSIPNKETDKISEFYDPRDYYVEEKKKKKED